jgi:hypothetical protein
MLLALAGLCSRADNAGVTSFVRVLNFSPKAVMSDGGDVTSSHT